jgi:tetratricopeptide (TPR) repeat protein
MVGVKFLRRRISMVAEERFDTAAAISVAESTLSLFSDTLQLASMAFQFVPSMAGVAGALSGVSSAFDTASKVLDGIDKVRVLCDKVVEIYDQHPDPAAHPQVADALITKAFTFIQSGHPAEALPVYDDLVCRFGADTDPSVVRSVRLARINATGMLNKLQRFEETLPRCGEIVERYGTDTDPAVVVDVLSARLNKMEALGELQRTDEAFSCFDEIVWICDRFDSGGAQGLKIRVRQDHVSALGMKSMILLRQGKFGEALAASDEIIERFGADQHLEVRSGVARCLLARAAGLHHFERWQEEIDAYNEILATYSKDRSLRDIALNAAYSKVGLLLQLGRFKDAVKASDDIRQKFRNDRAVHVRTTMFAVDGYRGLGQHKKALKACDEFVDLIGSDSDVESRRLVAHVLRLKAHSLWALRREDEVPSVCDEIDRRFGGDPNLILRQEVAQALLDKGKALGQCDRWDEVAEAMDTVMTRYGEDADPVLREMSARARSNKTVALGQIDAGAKDHLPPAGGGLNQR